MVVVMWVVSGVLSFLAYLSFFPFCSLAHILKTPSRIFGAMTLGIVEVCLVRHLNASVFEEYDWQFSFFLKCRMW